MAMDESPPVAEATPAPIPERCGRCGYATTGMSGIICPECGFDVTKTTHLRVADRDWLANVVRGMWLTRVGATVALVANFSGPFFRAVVPAALGSPRGVSRIVTFAALGAAALGALLISLPDPSFEDPSESRRRRRLVFQVGLVGGAMLLLGRAILGPYVSPIVGAGMSVVALLVMVGVVRGIGGFAREIVARAEGVTEAEIKKTGAGAGWLYPVIAILVILQLLGWSRGQIVVAQRIETSVLGIGIIGIAFAMLSLSKASAAIKRELEAAKKLQR
jgi:ribosomal protein L37E